MKTIGSFDYVIAGGGTAGCVLAKGYVSEAEAREIVRFASALGWSRDQIRARCDRAAPWLGPAMQLTAW